jgi:hypothetical protein
VELQNVSERAVTDNPLSCEEVQELLPLFALGVLDGDEMDQVAAHLPLCPSCSADLVRFESVSAALATPVKPEVPDPAVRLALFERIAESPQETVGAAPIAAPAPAATPANVVSISKARTAPWRAWAAVAAAVLLILAGGAGYWINSLANDRDDAQQTVAMLTQFMAPGSTTVTLPPMTSSNYGDAQGVSKLMTDPSGDMIVLVANCPPSEDDRVYKVWVAIGDDRKVLGDMTIGSDGSGWMPVSMPSDMPNPEILGVSVLTDNTTLTDLFIGTMTS